MYNQEEKCCPYLKDQKKKEFKDKIREEGMDSQEKNREELERYYGIRLKEIKFKAE